MKGRLPELVLALVTVVWGGTFLATRTALHGTGPFTLLFLRFTLGAVLVGAFVRRRPTAREAQGALLVALVMMVAYGAQTVGLRTVGSARAAFLTAFYVPLVPLLQGPLTGRRPSAGVVAGAILAFVGLVVLSAGDGLRPGLSLGDALILVGSLASALQIVLVGRFASAGNVPATTTLQLAGVALLALSGAGAEGMRATPTGLALAAGLGVVGTAGAVFAMNWAQRTVSPARATLIYALEPVWAALFGALAGERLGVGGAIGGGLVIAGALVGEFVPDRRPVLA